MKHILFAGDMNQHSRAYHLYQAMTDLNVTVSGITTVRNGHVPGFVGNPPLLHRVQSKLGFPVDTTHLNEGILAYIEVHNCPDLLWLHKAITVHPHTLQSVKRRCPSTRIVFASVDNMLKRHNQSYYFRKSAPLIDTFYTKRMASWNEFAKLGFHDIREFPFGFNRNFFPSRPKGFPYKYDVVFIGAFEAKRAASLTHLARSGVHVTVFGNKWIPYAKSSTEPNLHIECRPIYDEEFVNVLHRSRIALGFLRKINDDVVSSRSLEIPATGTFMLAERTDLHRELFEEGKEAEYFSDDDELVVKIRYYLVHSDERECIAQAGRKRREVSGYSYQDRMAKLLAELDF